MSFDQKHTFFSKPIVLVLCIGGGCGCDSAPDRHDAVAESVSPNRFRFHRFSAHVVAAQRLCCGRRCSAKCDVLDVSYDVTCGAFGVF